MFRLQRYTFRIILGAKTQVFIDRITNTELKKIKQKAELNSQCSTSGIINPIYFSIHDKNVYLQTLVKFHEIRSND